MFSDTNSVGHFSSAFQQNAVAGLLLIMVSSAVCLASSAFCVSSALLRAIYCPFVR
ncbi:hypothetical protein [Methanococcoides sp. NM1]|uniref:hypothetical protein n=1 Tax=Methanococcoides sp. NM1 TaxID=1201013 RepID=UPI0014385C5F|nr:hypothetical protein [Methanococcoides sp. NM1]